MCYICVSVHVYMCMYIHEHTNTHIPQLCLLKGPRSYTTPIGISTFNTLILISQYHSPQKDPWLLGEMIDSTTGAE